MIVTSRHRRKRPAKAPQAPLVGPRIVKHTPYRMRDRPVLLPNPEADKRIKLFFAEMLRPR